MYFKTVKCLMTKDGRVFVKKLTSNVKKTDVVTALAKTFKTTESIKFRLVDLKNQMIGFAAKIQLLRRDKKVILVLRKEFILIIDRARYAKLMV